MEKLKQLFLKRSELLAKKDKLFLEITIKEKLITLPKNIKEKNSEEILETYYLLKENDNPKEKKKCFDFIIDQTSSLLNYDNLITLKRITSLLNNDFIPIISNKLINYFNNKVNQFRKDMLAHDTYEMYQLFLNLDSNNKFGLQIEMNNILIKNINYFLKKGESLLKNNESDLLLIDRWLEECYLFMDLRVELKNNELRQLLSKIELFYLNQCINLVFRNDKVHGNKDLFFLVKRIHKRQKGCELKLEIKIKETVFESKILNEEEKEDLCRILEINK